MVFLFVRQLTNKLCLLTIQESFLNELHKANYFNNGFVQLPYYKVPVIIKNNNFTFCPGKSRENFMNIFQDLKTKFKDFPGLFQDVATL